MEARSTCPAFPLCSRGRTWAPGSLLVITNLDPYGLMMLCRPRRWREIDPAPESATQWEAFVTSELVGYEERAGIGYVTLNRPAVLNALNDDLIKQLREVLYQLDDDAN